MPLHLMLSTLLLFATAPFGTRAAARPAGPVDSLELRLERAEATATGARAAGEAALLLGRFHFARGEYRPSADAFARAAARLDPARKSEALYWSGLSWLGLGSPSTARAALEEVASSSSPRRREARVGIADAWEQEGRPDRAYAELEQVLAGEPGEAGAPALDRLARLADRLHRPGDAERARTRLLASYPSSMEAAIASAALQNAAATAPASGPVLLEGGRFASASRAKALAARAVRAGFANARVVERGSGATRVFAVTLGSYHNHAAARQAQTSAARLLGLSTRMAGER